MMKSSDKTLTEAFIKAGLLSVEDAQQFLAKAPGGESLGDYLIDQGAPKDKVLDILAAHFKLPAIDLKTTAIAKDVIERVPVKFTTYYKFIPIKIEGKALHLAAATPLDVKIQDEIRVYLGFEPKVFLATEADINDALKHHYGLAADTIDRILTKEPERKEPESSEKEENMEDVEKKSEDASVIKLVNQIILEAYKKRATDIHIEPYRSKVRFRYRIDGMLVDANLPAEIKHFLLPILSRIKIMANLSIVEKRLPQDGSTVVKTKDQTLDLRISTIPTPRGESMVIRILPTKVMTFSLEKLGIDPNNVKIFRELIEEPNGILFVTGPTGSGKTTTLYACLNEINSEQGKIITIEDPIEYEMEGITQIQTNAKVGLTFAAGLRNILRHDPDVIMVGEVRDLETAEIAIRTALTGHLVFSSLHTNDAASGVTRLIEMGVEPYLVASSIRAFIAQRLVRIICPHCKEEVKEPLLEIREEIQRGLQIKDINKVKIYKGHGCEHCSNTGFFGRTAIHEILKVDDDIRAVILEKPRADRIKELAQQKGMITLRQDGWKKVLEGVTTPTEVMNVTSREEYPPLDSDSSSAKGDRKDKEKKTEKLKEGYRLIPKEVLMAKNEYETRTYERAFEKVKILYRIFHEESVEPHGLTVREDQFEHSTVTKNISAGGLLFVAPHSIAPGTILEFKIRLKEGSPSIDCLAKVCRVEEDDLANVFNIGAYYLDIVSADRVKIDDFVKLKAAIGKK